MFKMGQVKSRSRIKQRKLKERIHSLETENESLKMKNPSFEIRKAMEKLHVALKPRYFRMDELVANPGLEHVAQKIFQLLDREDLKNCQLVSKAWRDCIRNDKIWWYLQVGQIYFYHLFTPAKEDPFHRRLIELYPEFTVVFDYLFRDKSAHRDLKLFVEFMQEFTIHEAVRGKLHEDHLFDTDGSKRCPLHFAVVQENVETLELFMKTGIDMNISRVENGYTPLHAACFENKPQIVKLFLENRLENPENHINFSAAADEENDDTPFHIACAQGAVDIVKLFIENAHNLQIDVNAKNEFDETPFMAACRSWEMNTEVVDLLLESNIGIDFNARDGRGKTALHLVCEVIDSVRGIYSSCNDKCCECPNHCNDIRMLRCLLKHARAKNIDVNARDKEGQTPLHYACSDRHAAKIKAFLRAAKTLDIDVNARDNYGRTPLHAACNDIEPTRMVNKWFLIRSDNEAYNYNESFEALFRHSEDLGIDIEATDEDGRTPFHILAVTGRNSEMNFYQRMASKYDKLLDFNARDNEGDTPVSLARIRTRLVADVRKYKIEEYKREEALQRERAEAALEQS